MKTKFKKTKFMSALFTLASLLVSLVPTIAHASVASTIPFQGRFLASPGVPAANKNFEMRFSFWGNPDFSDGVDRVNGELVGTTWSETVSVTTDSSGFFFVEVGNTKAFPIFDANAHKYLQAEVKLAGNPDTSFFLLDNMPSNPVVDRKSISNSAYAQNSARLNGHALGFNAGEVPFLNADGVFDRSILDIGTWLNPVTNIEAMNAIATPEQGAIVFVQSENSLYSYNGIAWDKIGTDLQNAVDQLNIDVAQNSSDITTNASNILANLTAIQSNDVDIASNLAQIQLNDVDIASNLAQIQSNDNDIDGLNTRVTVNEGDIANRYTKQEIDNQLSELVSGLSWQDAVDNVSDLAIAYPNVKEGTTAYVSNVGEIYTFNGTAWVKSGASFFQIATEDVAGKVVLAADSETTGGKAVQGNDSRLAQVAVNTSNITSNAATISINASDISTNASGVAANVSALDDLRTFASAGFDTFIIPID